jgi:Omp85 superfamily domain
MQIRKRRSSFATLAWVMTFQMAWGQNTPATSPSTSARKSSPTWFGTNVNVEGITTDKGATLGAGPSEGEKRSTSGKEKKHRGEFAVAPIPMINPSIGNGGGLGALYTTRFSARDTSPPSTFGAAGFGTAAGSWGLGLGAKLYLHNDRYRILVGGGGGEFNYNFFGVGTDAGSAGISIPLSQRSRAFLIEPKIGFLRDWYIGPRYHLITNHISLGSHELNPGNLPIPLPSDLDFQTAALGVRTQRDTSDSQFYPRQGSLLDVVADFFDPVFGADGVYKSLTTSYNQYLGIGKKNVLAIHGSVCAVTSAAPFFDVCILGMSKDLRGYQIGQYRDDRMLVGQMEYRRKLFWRTGVVAFAGAGAVGKTFDQFGSPEPGGGVGVRFILAKQNHINLRFDYAWGNNSHAAYVSLGEAF